MTEMQDEIVKLRQAVAGAEAREAAAVADAQCRVDEAEKLRRRAEIRCNYELREQDCGRHRSRPGLRGWAWRK